MSKLASMHASGSARAENDGLLVPSRTYTEIQSELGFNDPSSEVVSGMEVIMK